MKRLYLASSIDRTGGSIAVDLQKETGKKAKDLKLAFVYTAAEPEGLDEAWLKNDRNGLVKAGFNVFDYTITNKSKKDVKKDLESADVIHVNGGNTFYLLLQARKSTFDKWIKEEVIKEKKIYIGSSAGSMLVSPNIEVARKIEEKDYKDKLKNFKAVDLVGFITFPHWGSDEFRSTYLDQRMEFAYKPENKIILLNDWQYVKVVGEMYKIFDVRD